MNHSASDFSVRKPGDKYDLPCGCQITQTKAHMSAVIGALTKYCSAHSAGNPPGVVTGTWNGSLRRVEAREVFMGTMQGTITVRVVKTAQSWDGTSPELVGWKASIFDTEQTEHEATNHLWALAHKEVATRAIELVNFSRAARGAEGLVKL